jgi:predicted nucleic-acid-binding protein
VRALDTNVLVRFVTADDSPQAARVRELFRAAEGHHELLFVSLPVILELIWVLGSSYGTPKPDITQALQDLLGLPYLRFEQDGRIRELLAAAPQSPLALGDLLVGLCGRDHGCTTTLTFDRNAARSPLFTAL